MSRRPSRSHCTTAPPTNTLPSSAYYSARASRADLRGTRVAKRVPTCAAQVVSKPFFDAIALVARIEQQEAAGAVGIFRHAGRVAGLAEQRRLLVAGDARDRHVAPSTPFALTPNRCEEGSTSGSIGAAPGKSRAARRPTVRGGCRRASCAKRCSDRYVEFPPVSFHASQLSTVPNASSPRSACSRRPGMLSSIHASLVAEKYGSRTRPVLARMVSPRPLRFSASQLAAVRRSCQTIALCTGSPVRRSQTSVVSRWLAMPIAARRSGRSLGSPQRGARAGELRAPDFIGIVLDPARLGKDLPELLFAPPRAPLRAHRRRWRASWWCPGRAQGRISSMVAGAGIERAILASCPAGTVRCLC